MKHVAVLHKSDMNTENVGLVRKWLNYLTTPIDGASVAVFRMCLAACMLASVWMYTHQIEEYYTLPKIHFSFIPGMLPLPGSGMVILFCIMAFAAGCIGSGLFYRPAMLIFGAAQTYLFLLDKSYYQNHYYLVCLLCLLMFFIPANRVWSLDNASGKAPQSIPRWGLLTLKLQFFIVYFYAGIAKINYDWLHGQPQTAHLQHLSHNPALGWLGQVIAQPWFAQLVTWGGLGFDLSIGFILWYRPTFWLGALLACVFHVLNSQMFEIGIFPWLMLSTIPIFAAPNWPRTVLGKLGIEEKKQQVSYAEFARQERLGAKEKPNGTSETSQQSGGESNTRDGDSNISVLNIAVIAFLHFYFIGQILMPLRHIVLYPGDPSWTEEGHRFSWQMMLRAKRVADFKITAIDPLTGHEIPEPQQFMNYTQLNRMQRHPDMLLQYAHRIADDYQEKTGVRPIVTVKALEILNLRPAQNLIDPTVNLANETQSIFRPTPWIVPLKQVQ